MDDDDDDDDNGNQNNEKSIKTAVTIYFSSDNGCNKNHTPI